ncbi:Cytochrome P450 monooxygenase sdnE [Lachnellula suecica]|uniref:Cytochrome P450 monooxygenase sdnE n=1 Tax=Lachnellula suecica TaxID=602035 RepID=A0A8T9C4G2_9HELO|nr:Cytochrome P450 monooxygenase sdnE [Lachnellula suecica]
MNDLLSLKAGIYALGGLILLSILHVAYSVFLGPLSKFPGPKLAAATRLYEQYFDLVLEGRFPWQVEDLHKRYGPIIRIAPDELHINDPAYATTHFSSAPSIKSDKYYPHRNRFGIPESTFGTVNSDLHNVRRSAVNPFFSKRSINNLEPMIRSKVDKVCEHLDRLRASSDVLDLRQLFPCLTADVVTEYLFPESFDFLSTPDLAPGWRKTLDQNLRGSNILKHYPFLWSVMRSIPDSILLSLAPSLKDTIKWERNNQRVSKDIVDTYKPNSTHQGKKTIFHELLGSDLPPQEKSYERLWQEASSIVGAGTETTANALTIIMYYLIAKPNVMARLKEELLEAIPNPDEIPKEIDLEGLPYLSAVISEGLHKANGVTNRLIKVATNTDLHYQGYTIPQGTAVSMNTMSLQKDPRIFPDPDAFKPERWLGEKTRGDLFCWSRGRRACLGIK